MAKIYRIYNTDITHNAKPLFKASATVIPEGSLVALSAGLAILATATSTSVGYCETGGADGETEILVITDDRLVLSGTADANFAAVNRGAEVDITTTTQLIDIGASVTDVLKILPSTDAGTIWATTDVRVRINKSL